MKKGISIIIFWGSVWGITEATLGHILHIVSFNVGWAIWFPLAFYFMNKAYKDSGDLKAVLFTSIIASAIKLADLLMPVRIDKVLNPSVSILLEGLVVFAVYKLLENKEKLTKHKFVQVLMLSFGWRALYILYILCLPTYFISISPIHSLNPFLKFFFLESIINSLIIYGYIKIEEKYFSNKSPMGAWISPSLAFFQLAVALYIQLVA